jgi:hypothetical protein
MAGRVANAEEDGFVFFSCPSESFLSPRIPIHWIMSMLKKI